MWPKPTMPTVLPKISTPWKDERFHSPSRRVASAAGIWRAVDSSSEMACSQAEWMLEVGALATMTPRSVAAAMSTLSRPTPARPTMVRFFAASRTSRSTVVAERTSRASASPTAASSSGRLGPSTQRTSTPSPRASTVDCASLSAMSTTGRPFWLTFLLLECWLRPRPGRHDRVGPGRVHAGKMWRATALQSRPCCPRVHRGYPWWNVW